MVLLLREKETIRHPDAQLFSTVANAQAVPNNYVGPTALCPK